MANEVRKDSTERGVGKKRVQKVRDMIADNNFPAGSPEGQDALLDIAIDRMINSVQTELQSEQQRAA